MVEDCWVFSHPVISITNKARPTRLHREAAVQRLAPKAPHSADFIIVN